MHLRTILGNVVNLTQLCRTVPSIFWSATANHGHVSTASQSFNPERLPSSGFITKCVLQSGFMSRSEIPPRRERLVIEKKSDSIIRNIGGSVAGADILPMEEDPKYAMWRCEVVNVSRTDCVSYVAPQVIFVKLIAVREIFDGVRCGPQRMSQWPVSLRKADKNGYSKDARYLGQERFGTKPGSNCRIVVESTGEEIVEDEQLDAALAMGKRFMYLQDGEHWESPKPESPKLTPIRFLKDKRALPADVMPPLTTDVIDTYRMLLQNNTYHDPSIWENFSRQELKKLTNARIDELRRVFGKSPDVRKAKHAAWNAYIDSLIGKIDEDDEEDKCDADDEDLEEVTL